MSTPGPALYLDTSALVKLVRDEAESVALAEALASNRASLASSELADIELIRAIRRHTPDLLDRAEALLDRIFLLPLTSPIRNRAKLLLPGSVRSLDAIHIATVLEISSHLTSVISYDRRMTESLEAMGLPVISPGLS